MYICLYLFCYLFSFLIQTMFWFQDVEPQEVSDPEHSSTKHQQIQRIFPQQIII